METHLTTALLLIDIQNDYFPGGAMELVGATEAGVQAGKLLAAFRRASLQVIHIQHISVRPGASFFVPGTTGIEIHDSVRPNDGEPIFQKNFPNSFRDTGLLEHLRRHEVSTLVIAGMMTQMCVDTTTRAATDLGFACQLAHDACATRNLSFNGATVSAADVQVAYMAALNGLFAKVMATDEIVAGL